MEKLYFAFVDTPGFFASIIRKTIGISYVHVVVALDRHLKEAYSVGRRNPSVPVIAGFEREELNKILHAFPTARYKIVSMTCSSNRRLPSPKHCASATGIGCITTTASSDCLFC